MEKKVLVIGATGAMGVYLVPELLNKGYKVTGISMDDVVSSDENLTYIKKDASDIEFLTDLLKQNFDAIVDFMVYTSKATFEKYYKLFLENTKHYIYLSTYRVYANNTPLTEESPRLYDIELPDDFVYDYEYSIYKAEGEEMLKSSGFSNFTIIRPAITYSKKRFQLTILEADTVIYRMANKKTVILPENAMDKQATMSWGGDVAKMISSLILNEKAMGESYTVATSEHKTWREIAEIYKEIGGLNYITVDTDTFLSFFPENLYTLVKQQLIYDRYFDRIVDNSKILNISGLKQSELMPIKEGLKRELVNLNVNEIRYSEYVNNAMDAYLAKL